MMMPRTLVVLASRTEKERRHIIVVRLRMALLFFNCYCDHAYSEQIQSIHQLNSRNGGPPMSLHSTTATAVSSIP